MVTMHVIMQTAAGSGHVDNMSLSRDGKSLFLAGGGSYTAGILNLDTKEEVVLFGHKGEVACITQCEDTEVLTGSRDRNMRRWNMLTGECLMIYRGHAYGVINSIIYDKATMRIFSASDDGTICVWNRIHTNRKICVIKEHGCRVKALARVNEKMIAACDESDTIKIWNTDTLACIMTMSTPTPNSQTRNVNPMVSIAVSPDRQFAITRTRLGETATWDFHSGKITPVSLTAANGERAGIVHSPNGRVVIAYVKNGGVSVIDVSPPFPFVVHEGVITNKNDKEELIYLLSNGAIRNWAGENVGGFKATSTCSFESTVRFTVHTDGYLDWLYAASSASAAQVWVEAIRAVAADLALHPDDRAHSAEQMIRRYRFNLLQTILVHLRNWKTRQWCIPREIVQVVGKYYF